jgi:hypothetical protein
MRLTEDMGGMTSGLPRRLFLRNSNAPFRTKFNLLLLGAVLVVLAVGLPTIGLISHELGERHSIYTCTVQSITYSPLRDGRAAWQLGTDCGGAIDINPSAAGQTTTQGHELVRELQTGQRYRMTVQGVLHTPLNFSVELLQAAPVPRT